MASLDRQRDYHPDIQTFVKWVRDNSVSGIIDPGRDDRSAEKHAAFLPYPLLEEHFKVNRRDNLKRLLRAVFPNSLPPVEADIVARDVPKVFCILLLIGKAEYISSFTREVALADNYLPFNIQHPPLNFPTCGSDDHFLEHFCDKQWKLCPLKMTYRTDVELQDSLILPIVKSKKIGEGGSATIYEIEILPEYNHLFCSHSGQTTDRTETCYTKTNTFALKTYNVNSHRASDYYDTEVNAFKLFRNTRDVNMIGFHGSFKQGGRFNLILEYANEKSLEDYFQNTSPPQDGHDIIQFWESLCKVIFSINILHTQLCKPSSSKSQRINGWHQDVKPANILLSSVNAETNDRIASPYAWNFKLADMGISHFKPSEDGNTDQDSQGTKTYGAPECHRGDDVSRKNKIFVTPAVDICSRPAANAARW
ncbi:hypothetical protein V493_00126 [Pseudogymnoascus sp. VKM F-4281 (FW-2241)]|nr:hypothetical protein V493_00126 [Pseudogymnoascus sp. VKM F-4281 (FW-2241)]